MNKLKATLVTLLVTSVLCAGTLSARQLQKKAGGIGFCRGTCSTTKPCSGPCICQIFSGTTGGCVQDPGPFSPDTKGE